jgi:hypothetical protein
VWRVGFSPHIAYHARCRTTSPIPNPFPSRSKTHSKEGAFLLNRILLIPLRKINFRGETTILYRLIDLIINPVSCLYSVIKIMLYELHVAYKIGDFFKGFRTVPARENQLDFWGLLVENLKNAVRVNDPQIR